MSVRNLEAMFRPASVALIGASDRPGSIGNVVLRNIKQGGFRGPVWPVNRRHASVDGGRAWPDVDSLPQVPELAVICTPADTVPALIAQLGVKGTRAAIVLSAGLKRAPAPGEPSFEQAMLVAAKPHLLRILGPNCIGALVPGAHLNASFAPAMATAGTIAFVTQSGALATAMLDWAGGRGLGFSHFISLGDGADVDFADVLDYLAADPGTRAILMYAEAIRSGRKFMSAARAAARNKPVIMVKAGRAPDGARAAASHTGALAGSDIVIDAALRRAGVLRVDTLEALFDAAETLAHRRPMRGERLAVLTNGGGAGVLACDALAAQDGMLAKLAPATLAALDACLPATWSRGNPVDVIGDAPVKRYRDALRVLLAADEVNGLLLMHAPTALVPASDIAGACLPLLRATGKPVLACWLGGAAVAQARAQSAAAGIPCYATPERAAAAWLQLVQHHRNQRALLQVPVAPADQFVPRRARALAVLEQALAGGREWLDAAQAVQVLEAYGVPCVRTERALDVEQAVALAAQIGFPVALKIVSPQIVHKSDAGGVALGLATTDDVRTAAIRMRQQAARLDPHAVILGFTVQPMADRPHARELIAGIATDDVFGPVVLFGQGGIDVELSSRHAVALPALNSELARDLVVRSGAAPLLAAHRGQPGVNEAALLDTLLKVSQMACDLAPLAELDINPLLADAHGVLAVDARVRVHLAADSRRQLAIRPYPVNLEEQVNVGGADLLLRPIRPEDGQRMAAFYANATAADRRLRFFLSHRDVADSELARYSQIDYDREMAFIALAPIGADGDRHMVADVRAVCDPDNQRAEFSILVAPAWQRRGLGHRMMGKMIGYLRGRGTGEIVGQCLAGNTRMLELARNAGFEVGGAASADSVTLRLPLR